MPISYVSREEAMPEAEVLFRIRYLIKGAGREELQTYTELFRDENGMQTIEAYLHRWDLRGKRLRESYRRTPRGRTGPASRRRLRWRSLCG